MQSTKIAIAVQRRFNTGLNLCVDFFERGKVHSPYNMIPAIFFQVIVSDIRFAMTLYKVMP